MLQDGEYKRKKVFRLVLSATDETSAVFAEPTGARGQQREMLSATKVNHEARIDFYQLARANQATRSDILVGERPLCLSVWPANRNKFTFQIIQEWKWPARSVEIDLN